MQIHRGSQYDQILMLIWVILFHDNDIFYNIVLP